MVFQGSVLVQWRSKYSTKPVIVYLYKKATTMYTLSWDEAANQINTSAVTPKDGQTLVVSLSSHLGILQNELFVAADVAIVLFALSKNKGVSQSSNPINVNGLDRAYLAIGDNPICQVSK